MAAIALLRRPRPRFVIDPCNRRLSHDYPGHLHRFLRKSSQAVLSQHVAVQIVKFFCHKVRWARPGERVGSSRRGKVIDRPPLRHYRVSRRLNQKKIPAEPFAKFRRKGTS